jgi:hypothetical protein
MIRRISLLMGVLLLTGAAEAPKKIENLPPSEAAKEGRALVDGLLAQRPDHSISNTGVLTVRANKKTTSVPVRFTVETGDASWTSTYEALGGSNSTPSIRLVVKHAGEKPNEYELTDSAANKTTSKQLAGNESMIPFAGSDFWLADLGLEFLHWPEQKLWRTEMKRSRSCRVLESVNPKPVSPAYSRVVSWIDNESGGIVHADAYDAKGKLLKEFDPKDFKKVNGEWQLEEMEIYNRQTDSRTRIEFSFGSK